MKTLRELYEKQEDEILAPYAMKALSSRGRRYPEAEHEARTCFQRDRDRIIYSTAFRRLQYKTQVFVNHEGDHFRTRLTHTIETAQISGTVARALRLNEDLVAAVALGHDLGHGPFGHAGEWALREMMSTHGGFEHNVQGLRVVETLENIYPDFCGLNLTIETLDGLKKHPERFDDRGVDRCRTLEGELVDVADEIAYSAHDLDDGIRSGLISMSEVSELQIWRDVSVRIDERFPGIKEEKRKEVAIRFIINAFVMDLIEESMNNIKEQKIESCGDLQTIRCQVISLSADIKRQHAELKRFLMDRLYRHPYVLEMTNRGQDFLKGLFTAYSRRPELLPPEVLDRNRETDIHRVICDYLAGMTDRFAADEYARVASDRGA